MSNTIYHELITTIQTFDVRVGRRTLNSHYTTLWHKVQAHIPHFDINLAPLRETIYTLKHGLTDYPKCTCGNDLIWRTDKYNQNCSRSCGTTKLRVRTHISSRDFDFAGLITDAVGIGNKLEIYQELETVMGSMVSNNNKYKPNIMKHHKDLWAKIMHVLPHLDVNSISIRETAYALKHQLSGIPSCTMCENKVIWCATNQCYKEFCSRSCSAKFTFSKYNSENGVTNASQLESIKDKKKDTMMERYGVENPSNLQSVRDAIGAKCRDRWDVVYEGKKFTADGFTYKQYRHRVNQYSHTQYIRNIDILDPDRKRSNEWHIDHVYSVHEGFKNDVPVNVIGDISNLRMLSAKDNYAKFTDSHKTLEELYSGYKKGAI